MNTLQCKQILTDCYSELITVDTYAEMHTSCASSKHVWANQDNVKEKKGLDTNLTLCNTGISKCN